MKIFRQITWCILLASCFAVFTACSSDDPAPTPTPPTNPNSPVKSVAGMTMTYNTDGKLTKITDTGNEVVTFDYNPKTVRGSGEGPQVVMTITDAKNANDVRVINITLNNKGYAKSCIQTYKTSQVAETWDFSYNTADQLNYMKRSEGETEVTNIKYDNGCIIEVTMTSNNVNNSLKAQIAYTNSKVSQAILNYNSIMLFDETFDIDMDEMAYAYWAGLLGKPTKYLPVQISSRENGGAEDVEFFDWTFKDGYVQKMTATGTDGTDIFNFTW